jgi:hypothetical protein
MQAEVRPLMDVEPRVVLGGRRRDDARLTALMTGFDELGGVASSDEVVGLMRPHWRQPISMLARWIVTRQLVTFTWKTQLLMPLFQFERPRMAPLEGVVDVVRTLTGVLDDEGIALWFVQPNANLEDARPLDVVVANPIAVFVAACKVQASRAGPQGRL